MTDTERWFIRAVLFGMGVGLILYGCTACAPPAPKHPTPVKAPPPAYGNKVV